MRKPWADELETSKVTEIAKKYGFSDVKSLSEKLCEAAWSYRRRAKSLQSHLRRHKKHFLTILKNRLARGSNPPWPKGITYEDAIELGVAGWTGPSASNNPAALLMACDQALSRLKKEKGGAPRNLALDFWLRSLILIYESGTGKKAAVPVTITREGKDRVVGPFSRFVVDACLIANIEFPLNAARSKLRRLIRDIRIKSAKKQGGSDLVPK